MSAADLPAPLTPPECDIRGMPYMPLDIVRLFDSDLYALTTGDEFKAALTLWGRAFLQVPAGSLPDNERILAHLSNAGAGWPQVREMALRGWVKCSDGRLYHPVVSEKAREAWQARLERRRRTEAARQARDAQRQQQVESQAADGGSGQSVTDNATTSVTDNATTSVTDNVTGSKGREVKGREESKEGSLRSPPRVAAPARISKAEIDAAFEEFWRAYPRKEDKGGSRKAYARAVAKLSPADLLSSLQAYSWPADPQFTPYPSSWLSKERWLDEPSPRSPARPAKPGVEEQMLRNMGMWPPAPGSADRDLMTIHPEGYA